jgi:hypothetical protein
LLASPLVFKKNVKITEAEKLGGGFGTIPSYELTVFDSAKYKKVRVAVTAFAGTNVYFDAIEDRDALNIGSFKITPSYLDFKSGSILIDTPPTTLRIGVSEIGIYTVYIWAD